MSIILASSSPRRTELLNLIHINHKVIPSTIKETIDVPIIKKLVHLHNKEANVKTFIASLANNYSEKINEALEKNMKKYAKKMLEKEPNEAQKMKSDLEKMKELATATKKTSRALFSDDTTQKVLSHKSKYKLED